MSFAKTGAPEKQKVAFDEGQEPVVREEETEDDKVDDGDGEDVRDMAPEQ